MTKSKKSTKIKKKHVRKDSLINKIVSLTVFLDAIFLILVLAGFILMYYINAGESRLTNAEYQNQIVIDSVEDILKNIELDTHLLAQDSDIINYINYVNEGNPIVVNPGDPNYNIYSNFIVQTESMVNYHREALYDLVYIATSTNCSVGNDGCAVSQSGDSSSIDWKLSERPWYMGLSDSESVLTNPYMDGLTGEYVLSYVEKVYDNEVLIGYVGIDIKLSSLALLFDDILEEKLPEKNQTVIISNIREDGRVVYYSGDTYESYYMQSSDNFKTIDLSNNFGDKGMDYIYSFFNPSEPLNDTVFGDNYIVMYTEIEGTSYSTVTLYYVGQVMNLEVMFAILFGGAIIVILFMAFIIHHNVKKSLEPIENIMKSIEEIKKGNYDVNIKIEGTQELKQIGDAINIMSEEIDKQVKKTYESLAYDGLTGLKSRASSSDELDATIFKADKRAAVCLIQVDNLKNINVTKGQMIGDNLIKAIADELKHVFRNDETLFSNGGNEFIYIKDSIKSLEEVEYALNRLLTHFKDQSVIKTLRAEVKFYIGVSVYPTDGNTLDELIKKCDTALFKATEASFKKIIFYNEKIARSVSYQSEISEQLAQAIKNDQIYLKYQPLITNDSEVYGFEALARWTSPTLGEIGPQVFIANAEESYLIIPIGTWILKEACKAQVKMKEKFGVDFVMSVNVSPVQILQRDFVDIVKKTIRETGINADYLTLEITESLFLEATILLEDTIEEIHKLGVKLSLDDFGTGYASLTYLRQIKFDNLKIDKTFVDGIYANIKDHRIIGTIVNLVHNLDMKVIAEGVETRRQYEYLKEISTDVFQGFIFSKPLLLEDVYKFVEKFNRIAKHRRAEVFAKINK